MANSVFDRMKQAANAAANAMGDMGKKAGEKVEIGKINSQIAALKRENTTLYQQIGEMVYQCPDDVFSKEACQEQIQKLEENYNKIQEMVLHSATLRGVIVCPSCGRECADSCGFCPGCGAKLEKPEPPAPEPEKVAEEPEKEQENPVE